MELGQGPVIANYALADGRNKKGQTLGGQNSNRGMDSIYAAS
jgi:hypothetical protein